MIRYNEALEMFEVVCEECGDVLEMFDTEAEAEDFQYNEMYSIDLYGDVKEVGCCCEDEFIYCDGCGHYHYSCDVNMYRVGYDWYCEESAVESGYYMYCEGCGDLIDVDFILYSERMDAHFCEYCYPQESDIIAQWHDHKHEEPCFNYTEDDVEAEDSLFFGLEIEVDGKGIDYSDNVDTAEYIRENIFDADEMYFEEDGSLWNGFELITQPMTYNYIQDNEDKFEELCNLLQRRRYTGEDNKSAGLHIHVSRQDISEKAIENIIYFLENNLEDVHILSRRGRDLNSYANSYCFSSIEGYRRNKEAEGDLDKGKVLYCYGKNEYDRYRILNTCNRRTIEFRLFKSTIDVDKLLGTIDFVNTLVLMAQCNTLKDWHTVEDIIHYSDSQRLKELFESAQDKYYKLLEKAE